MSLQEILTGNKNLINYAQVSDVKNVYRVDFAPQGQTVAKIFIDDSGEALSSAENIDDYQEKILKSEYYQAKGSMPWNLYLYFLVDEATAKSQKDNIAKIEQNDMYSRKKFITLDSLKTIYPFGRSEEIGNLINKNQLVDPSIDWIEKLQKAKMNFVYDSEAPLEASVEAFIEGTYSYFQVAEKESESQHSYNLDIKPRELNIVKYRKYPKPDKYQLGKVNVLFGPNAVGKTSFLEAIELIITGETFRNKIETGDVDISITDSKNNVEAYEPDEKEKFRARDHYWYQNRYVRGNYLNIAFNRFNCYNTDAAFELSTADTHKDLREALEALALGAKTKEILDRIQNFEGRFKTAHNANVKEKNRLETEKTYLIVQKENLDKKAKTVTFNFATHLDLLKETFGISLVEDSYSESEISNFKNNIYKVHTYIESINQVLKRGVFQFTPSEWSAKLQVCNTLSGQMDAYRARLEQMRPKLIQEKNRKEVIQAKNSKVIRLLEYLNFSNTELLLKGLDNEIITFRNKIKILELAENIVLADDMNPTDADDKPLDGVLSRITSLGKSYTDDLDKIKIQINVLNSAFENTKKQILDIKSMAKILVQQSVDSRNCPVCQHEHISHDELLSLIAQVNFPITQNDKLISDRSTLEGNLIKLQTAKARIDRILKAIQILGIAPGSTIQEMLSQITSALNDNSNLKSKITDLENLKNNLEAAGFSEREFISLIKEVLNVNTLSDFKSVIEDLNLKLSESNLEMAGIDDGIRLGADSLKEEFSKVRSAIEFLIGPRSDDKISEEFYKYRDDLKSLCQAYADLTLVSTVSEKLDVHLAALHLKQLLKETEEYILYLDENLKNSTVIADTKGKLEENELNLKECLPKYEQSKLAFETLTGILTVFKESNPIDSFFKFNMKLVAEIFKQIHAPFEFVDVKFENDSFALSRDRINYEPITKISTGQRSALALSVFFAVHLSCKTAPKILIFDDPVSYVDDLNILSFLDFLRELVIEQDKQIFIATANHKLAALIQKKFDFLGSEFISREFSR